MRIYKNAMTLGEILISLTIIGMVATMTLPALRNNINEKAWKTQKKALYSRISQAIPLVGTINGYGVGATNTQTQTNAAQAFIIQGLSKHLKLNNICSKNQISKCGLPEKIVANNGTKVNMPKTMYELNSLFSHSGEVSDVNYSTGVLNTDVAAFETVNGDTVAVFYNPNCGEEVGIYGQWNYTQPLMCVNFLYDVNGTKGPNSVGKDVGFITVLYPFNSVVVSPQLSDTIPSGEFDADLLSSCNSKTDDIIASSKEEIFSIFYNNNFANVNKNSSITCLYSTDSGTVAERDDIFYLDLTSGKWQKTNNPISCLLPCVNK